MLKNLCELITTDRVKAFEICLGGVVITCTQTRNLMKSLIMHYELFKMILMKFA